MSTDKINVFAVGGLDENGKNMYCIESPTSIIIIDAGIRNPRHNEFSGQLVAPGIDYLVEKKHKIKSVFLSHCHSDQCGAILYMQNHGIKFDVYCTKFTRLYLQEKNKDIDQFSKINFIEIDDNFQYSTQDFYIESFPTFHSAPGSIAFNVITEQGSIVYLTDFIFGMPKEEKAAAKNFVVNLMNIKQKTDVLLLMCESINADKPGFTTPHHIFIHNIDKWFEQPEKKIIASCFDNNFNIVKQIISSAKFTNRKIYVIDQIFYNILHHAIDDGYLPKTKINLIKTEQEYEAINENCVVILATEGQALFNTLFVVASNEHKIVHLTKDDRVVNLAIPYPGVELQAAYTYDELSRHDCKINTLKSNNYRKMHASSEDIKLVTTMLEPKYFMPIKGLYKNFIASAKSLTDIGFNKNNILLRDNGELIAFKNKNLLKNERFTIDCTKQYINVHHEDVHSVVLQERKHMSRNGIIFFAATVDSPLKKIVTEPVIKMKGLITSDSGFIKQLKEFFIKKIKTDYFNTINDGDNNKKIALNELNRTLFNFVKKNIKKYPFISIHINDINF